MQKLKIILGIGIIFAIIFAGYWIEAWIYGDWRCVFVECRILK